MTRILLFLLFFVLLAADTLDLNLSLAPGLSVKNAFLYLILVGIAVDAALKRNRQIEGLAVIAPYSLYIFYAIFTMVIIVLFIDYPNYRVLRSVVSLKAQLGDNLLVFLVFFFGVLSSKDAMWLIKAMVWTVIVGNFITVIDGFNVPDLGIIAERLDGRISGPIGESNQFAAFLTLFLPATVAMVLVERGTLRIIAVLGVVVSLLAFLMTASRGGFLGFFVGSLLAAIYLRRFISIKVTLSTIGSLAFLAIAAVGILYLAGFGDLLHERLISDSTGGSVTRISSGRTYIWMTALEKMMMTPISLITGFGWDTYTQFRSFRYAPHNSYLKIFFELGSIGLSLVLVTLANVLRQTRKSLELVDGETKIFIIAFIVGFGSILVAIFFVDIASPWIFLWAYTGALMRLVYSQTDARIP